MPKEDTMLEILTASECIASCPGLPDANFQCPPLNGKGHCISSISQDQSQDDEKQDRDFLEKLFS